MPVKKATTSRGPQYVTLRVFESAMTAIKQEFDRMGEELKELGKLKELSGKITKSEESIKRELRAEFRQSLDNMAEKIMTHIDGKIDAAVENRKTDLLGVTSDDISHIKDQTRAHEKRITVLEHKIDRRGR